MYQNYLITGATGFLGRAVLQLLLAHSCRVLALVMDKDPLAYTIPENVTVFCGDLTDKDTLRSFFAAGGDSFCVLHCAGIVSIASKPDEAIYRVNVQGTRNIVDLSREFGAGRLIYVSSVHAIPEKPAPETITEPDRFAPDEILGDYGKSKAMATALVLEAAQNGLNASVVLPSGIIGPGDLARGNMTRMLLAFCRGQLPLGVNGGYDFVDVRDVAVGVLACAERGKAGECYILSGHYTTIQDMFAFQKMSVCNLLVAASPAFIQQESAAVFPPPVLKAAFRQRADCRWFFNTKASVDKSTRACGPDWTAVRCVIVLDMRQHGLGPKERASADLTV